MTSARKPKIFCISCFHAGYAKKGACLARMKGKLFCCGRLDLLVCLVCLGCHEGELCPGLSGWMCWDAEVLELLAFWKAEQQAAQGFRIWRPLSGKFSYNIDSLSNFQRLMKAKRLKSRRR